MNAVPMTLPQRLLPRDPACSSWSPSESHGSAVLVCDVFSILLTPFYDCLGLPRVRLARTALPPSSAAHSLLRLWGWALWASDSAVQRCPHRGKGLGNGRASQPAVGLALLHLCLCKAVNPRSSGWPHSRQPWKERPHPHTRGFESEPLGTRDCPLLPSAGRAGVALVGDRK